MCGGRERVTKKISKFFQESFPMFLKCCAVLADAAYCGCVLANVGEIRELTLRRMRSCHPKKIYLEIKGDTRHLIEVFSTVIREVPMTFISFCLR